MDRISDPERVRRAVKSIEAQATEFSESVDAAAKLQRQYSQRLDEAASLQTSLEELRANYTEALVKARDLLSDAGTMLEQTKQTERDITRRIQREIEKSMLFLQEMHEEVMQTLAEERNESARRLEVFEDRIRGSVSEVSERLTGSIGQIKETVDADRAKTAAAIADEQSERLSAEQTLEASLAKKIKRIERRNRVTTILLLVAAAAAAAIGVFFQF